MKIIQIMAYPTVGMRNEYFKVAETDGDVLYGLSDTGNLYRWETRTMKLERPRTYIDEEDGKEKVQYDEQRSGWVLVPDRLHKTHYQENE